VDNHNWLAATGRRPHNDFDCHPPMKNIKIIIIVVLILLLGALVFQNRQPVKTDFLWITVIMPAILLLFLTASAGFVLGMLVAMKIRKERKKPQ